MSKHNKQKSHSGSNPSPAPSPSGRGISWIGGLACVFAVLFPVFPDEKLVRLKLEVFEIGIFVLAGLVGLRIFFQSQFKWGEMDWKAWLDPVFAVVCVWALVNGGLWFLSEDTSLASAELRRVILAFGAFFAFRFSDLTEAWKRRIFMVWALAGTLLALYGLMQLNGGFWMIMVPKAHRIMATFGNPIFFAVYLTTTFFVTCAAFSMTRNKSLRFLLIICLIVDAIALYHTKTRAAWISFGMCLLVWAVIRYGLRHIPVWGWSLLLLGLFLFGVKTQDTWKRDQGHLMIWRDTLRMWQDHPVTGVGLGAFHTEFPDYAQEDLRSKWPKKNYIVNYAHNEYVQTLAETGLIGFLSFMALLILFFRRIRRLARSETVPLFLAVLALLIQNFFSVDMRFSLSFATLFLLMGISLTGETGEAAPPIEKKSLTLRIPFALIWLAFLGFILFPKLMQPYRAHREFTEKVDFFDKRVLDPAKSISDLEVLAKKYPDEPSVLEKLAYVYAKEMKTRDKKINQEMAMKAIATYERLIELKPDHAGALNNTANILYTLGRVEDAMAKWKETVAVKPDLMDVHLNLGKIHYTRGELKEAAHHLQTVLKLDPDNAEAIVYLKRMVE